MTKRILVTGCAGFIGFHLCRHLLHQGLSVTGIDNLNDYYDPQLKRDRLALLLEHDLDFHELDLGDKEAVTRLFEPGFSRVVNLAAQAGVRYSLTNPHVYIDSNVMGFLNVLESCRHAEIEHLIYASSSSVYGANTEMPFAVAHRAEHPISLYGATKRANELMAHAYSYTFGLPTTGLRFFTVYGPWGRPDMALYLFARAILAGKPIEVYNHGRMRRDFTYVDDVVRGICGLLDAPPPSGQEGLLDQPGKPRGQAPFEVFNIGNHSPVELSQFIELIETYLGKKAEKLLMPMQPGDVEATFADVQPLERRVGFRPQTPIEEGIRRSMEWFKEYALTSAVFKS